MSTDNVGVLVLDLERRIARLEKVVTQLVAEARTRQGKPQDPRQSNSQDQRTVTEKVTFDWQGESGQKG